VVNTFSITDPTGTSNYSTSMTLFDSLGNGHLITTYFSKTAAMTWAYNVVGLESEVNTASYNAANINTTLGVVRLASGTLGFTTNGALNTASVATSYNNGAAAGAAGAVAGEAQINFLGATPAQLMAFDFGTSIAAGGTGLDGTTQFGSPSALVRQTQDGYAAGSLEGFSVDASGIVSGRFSNGQVRALAQVALARFPDPIGLVRTGKNMFAESGTSGQPIVGAPDTAGLGRILGNSLELSNVDLGESFIELITAQRGFQANSRVITTSDEVLQELVNLKR
jgi:flagellar hook protein FlgE